MEDIWLYRNIRNCINFRQLAYVPVWIRTYIRLWIKRQAPFKHDSNLTMRIGDINYITYAYNDPQPQYFLPILMAAPEMMPHTLAFTAVCTPIINATLPKYMSVLDREPPLAQSPML